MTLISYPVDKYLQKQNQKQHLQLFRKLLNYSQDILLVISPDSGQIIDINNRACRILGYLPDEILQKKITDISAKTNTIEKWRIMLAILRNTESVFMETSYKKQDGTLFPVEVSARVVNLKGSEYIIAVVHDISKRKEGEKKLKKSERVKKEKINELNNFLYRTTHDLKAPLASLSGLINLTEKKVNNNNTSEYFALMKLSVKRMVAMLNTLTGIIQSSKKKISPDVINFRALIDEIKTDFRHLPHFDEINFAVKTDMKAEFHTDKKFLLTILHNLIHNSVKYRKIEKSFICISIKEDVKGVVISVSDNGIGIPKHLQEKIFDMFFRATEFSQGSGLGLYIVKNTVQKLFGKIEVTSEEGEGATFTVFLPDILKYIASHKLSEDVVIERME